MGVTPLIDKETSARVLQDLTARTLQGGAKLGATFVSQHERDLQKEIASRSAAYGNLSKIDVSSTLGYKSSVATQIAVSPLAEAEPELFFGPFLQLGTYLEVENDALRWGMDILLDPLSWVGPGNVFKLSRIGADAALRSAIRGGGKYGVKTAEQALLKTERVLDFFGKTIGNNGFREEVLTAAKKGFTPGSYRKLLKSAEGVEMSGDVRKILNVMKRDRKAFARLIDTAHDVKRASLPFGARNLLQQSFRGQIATGQRTLIQGFAPLPFMNRIPLIGPKIRDFEVWVPSTVAGMFGEAGGKVVGNSLTRSVASSLGDIPLETRIAEGLDADLKFKVSGPSPGEIGNEHIKMQVDAFVAVSGAGSGPGLVGKPFGEVPLDKNPVMTLFEQIIGPQYFDPRTPQGRDILIRASKSGGATKAKVYKAVSETPLYKSFEKQILKDAEARAGEAAASQIARQERAFDQLKQDKLGSVERNSMTPEEVAVRTADVEATNAALRGSVQTEFLLNDQLGVDGAVFGARRLATIMANNLTELRRSTIARISPKRSGRETLVALQDSAYRRGGEMFDIGADGAARLRKGVDLEDLDPFLARRFELHPKERLFAETQGLPAELVEQNAILRSASDAIGAHQFLVEHTIPDFVGNYMTRVGSFTEKGRKILSVPDSGVSYEIGRHVLNQTERTAKEFEFITDLVKKTKNGKMTHEQARRATEKQLVAWERNGWYKIDKDMISNYSEYMDAAASSVLQNRLFFDLVDKSPVVTSAHEGKLAAAGMNATQQRLARGQPILLDVEPSAQMRSLYDSLGSRTLTGAPTMSEAAELAALESPETLQRMRIGIGDRLSGKSEIPIPGTKQTFKIVDKAGNPMLLDSGWINSGRYPPSLKEPMAVKAAVNRVRKAEMKQLRHELSVRQAEARKALMPENRTGKNFQETKRLWVMKGFSGPLVEAFGAYNLKGGDNGKVWRLIDKFNSNLKGTILAIDAFHGHTLLTAQAIANPASMKALALGKEHFEGGLAGARIAAIGALPRTAVSFALGSAGAAALGAEEPEEVLTGGFAMAFWVNAMTAGIRNSILSRKAAMTPGFEKAAAYAGLAGWTGRPNDRAIGVIGRFFTRMGDHLRKESGDSILVHGIDGVRHLSEAFDENIWGTIHNGGKMFLFSELLKKEEVRLGKGARKIISGIDIDLLKSAKEINAFTDAALGGQMYSRLFRDPNFQKWARRFMLSPDWTYSRLAGAANMMANMSIPQAALAGGVAGTAYEMADKGFDVDHMTANGFLGGAALGALLGKWGRDMNARMFTKGDLLARESRKLYGAALMGGFALGNLINHAFTGRWMWENDEGDRMKIVLPDGTRFGFGKAYKEVFEFTGSEEQYPVFIASRLASKASPVLKSAVEIWSNNTWNGPIISGDADAWERGGSYVSHFGRSITPIIGSGLGREASAIFTERTSVASGITRGIARGGGLNFLPPKRGAEVSSGLQHLAAPSLASQLNRNLAVEQRNLR